MKLPNPKIRVVNHVGQMLSVSFPESNGVTAARIAYVEGAAQMAKMFRQAIESGNMGGVMALARATDTKSFYEFDK